MKIDVHQHFAPEAYVRRAQAASTLRHGPVNLNRWTIESNLRALDRNGVDYGVASISAPGVWIGEGTGALELARIWNDAAHELCETSEGRFGFFGALPLPDQGGSLAEIERVSASPHLRGFSLFSNYQDTWLGSERYAQVCEALNRRRAIVFVHPTTAFGGKSLPDYRAQILEFPFDTTRAAASLVRAGCLDRYADIRFVLAHGGGCFAYLVDRIDQLDEDNPGPSYAAMLSRFYFDSALVSEPNIAHLIGRVPMDHILFGSDAPFSERAAPSDAQRFAESDLF